INGTSEGKLALTDFEDIFNELYPNLHKRWHTICCCEDIGCYHATFNKNSVRLIKEFTSDS
ncbi:hypothetical protein, partial [Clostridium sp.]|uniref:hypothetical protein n=1 Tax=Clostridium sp. TaxID=1506 RepID=UPI0028468299